MPPYAYNRNCACVRCRIHGLMGPAMIVTTGLLWLLDELTRISWHESWPVYMLVAGVIVLGNRTASAEGHVVPFVPVMPSPAQYQYPAQTWTGSQPPPPQPSTAGTGAPDSAPNNAVQPTDQQVKS